MRYLIRFLRRLFGRMHRIESKIDGLAVAMSTFKESTMGKLEDLAAALDKETNDVASRIDRLTFDLKAALAAGEAPKPATLDALAAISDRLKSLGADPAAPIPAPVAAPAPAAPPTDPAVPPTTPTA